VQSGSVACNSLSHRRIMAVCKDLRFNYSVEPWRLLGKIHSTIGQATWLTFSLRSVRTNHRVSIPNPLVENYKTVAICHLHLYTMNNLHDYWPLSTFFTNNLLPSLPAWDTATSPAEDAGVVSRGDWIWSTVQYRTNPAYLGMAPSNICLYPMVIPCNRGSAARMTTATRISSSHH
jgi:hypothetical protein